jgi:hypothetical protein
MIHLSNIKTKGNTIDVYCKCPVPFQKEPTDTRCTACGFRIKFESEIPEGCFDYNNMPANWLLDFDYVPYEPEK